MKYKNADTHRPLSANKRRSDNGHSDKYRVQLDLSGKALDELDYLKDLLSASTRAEVVREAMRWLYWCADEVATGSSLLVERQGQAREIVFPFAMRGRDRGGSAQTS